MTDEGRAEMERLTYEIIDGGMVTDKENIKEFEIEDGFTVYAGNAVFRLADYEDTGLTPPEIMEPSESVKKLQEHCGNAITVDQVIDFFVDFYIAQGNPERMEEALLLTNESVAEYRELKERDTAKVPDYEGDGYDKDGNIIYDTWICPNCGEKYEVDYDDYEHCPKCGQAIRHILEGMEDEL